MQPFRLILLGCLKDSFRIKSTHCPLSSPVVCCEEFTSSSRIDFSSPRPNESYVCILCSKSLLTTIQIHAGDSGLICHTIDMSDSIPFLS